MTSVPTRLSKNAQILVLIAAFLTISIGNSWGAKPDTSIPSKPEEHDAEGRPTDYKNPIRDGSVGGVPHYHVTVCEGTTLGPWHPWGSGHKDNEPHETSNSDRPTPPRRVPHGTTGSTGGTDGGVSIKGNSEGDSESTVSLTDNDGTVRTVVILIHVVKCTKENKGHRGVAASAISSPSGNPLETLIGENRVAISTVGTGETCGHIADLMINNLTDQPINCTVGPMILESTSRKSQDYVCPKTETVALDPYGTSTIPVNGVCVNRHKPPVGKGEPGDLIVNTGNPAIPSHADSHLPASKAKDLLRICASKYHAADKLQKDGELKDLPYKDKEKQKDIVVQWSTWSDPQICEIVGTTPATKDDLKKVVYKQLEPKGPMTPETKKKVDQGIDTIFEKVELTTAQAKDLEELPQAEESFAGNSVNVSNDTPTPVPETKEKPKKDKKDKKKKNKYLQGFNWWKDFTKNWPKPLVDWAEKKFKADWSDQWKQGVSEGYDLKFKDFLNQNKHYGEVKSDRDAAEKKANASGATQQDKDTFKQLENDLKKLENDLKQDFNKTDDGKKLIDVLHDAEKASDQAHAAEKEAGKNIDPASKEALDNYLKGTPPPPDLLHPPDPVQALW